MSEYYYIIRDSVPYMPVHLLILSIKLAEIRTAV